MLTIAYLACQENSDAATLLDAGVLLTWAAPFHHLTIPAEP